jgi:hypothetical protein
MSGDGEVLPLSPDVVGMWILRLHRRGSVVRTQVSYSFDVVSAKPVTEPLDDPDGAFQLLAAFLEAFLARAAQDDDGQSS